MSSPMPSNVPAPTPAPTPAPPPPAPAQSWFSGLEPEAIGHIQNRGWDKMDAPTAAVEAVKAFRSAEAKLGVPADRLLRRPTDGDVEGAKAFWQQLGAPADPKEYAFTGVDFGDADLTAKFTDAFRTAAASKFVPKDVAEHLASEMFKFIENLGVTEETALAAATLEERAKLEADWGKPDSDLFRANMTIADRTAANLGVPQEALDAMKESMGAAEVAKFFRKLGDMTGESRYVVNPGPNGGDRPITREQAIARRLELTGIDGNNQTTGKGDAAWRAKLFAGDAAAKKEWTDLTRIIAGV